MQLFKKILTILILLLMASFSLQAQKKPPQIPLKDLSDPSSHNYVPYPYPKTDFEIIEDFKYALRIFLNPEAMKRKKRINGDLSDELMLINLISENPTLKVTKIFRVENMLVTSPCLYNLLLQIEDENGKVVAMGRIDDCGLFGAVRFFTKGSQFKPYKTREQVKNILSDSVGLFEPYEIERIWIHSSLPVHPFVPLLRVRSSAGTFFVDYYDDVYLVKEEIPWTMRDSYPDPKRKTERVIDPLQNRILLLEKVRKK